MGAVRARRRPWCLQVCKLLKEERGHWAPEADFVDGEENPNAPCATSFTKIAFFGEGRWRVARLGNILLAFSFIHTRRVQKTFPSAGDVEDGSRPDYSASPPRRACGSGSHGCLGNPMAPYAHAGGGEGARRCKGQPSTAGGHPVTPVTKFSSINGSSKDKNEQRRTRWRCVTHCPRLASMVLVCKALCSRYSQ